MRCIIFLIPTNQVFFYCTSNELIYENNKIQTRDEIEVQI